MIVINGPTLARENCARPPVRFGISEFNSATDSSVRIFTVQAIAIVIIKAVPRTEEPIPNVNRQLEATTRPTPVAMTLPSPIFFEFIVTPPFCPGSRRNSAHPVPVHRLKNNRSISQNA